MGLFSKHKGRKAHSFVFSIQVHTLTSPSSRGSLVVACERGKHHAATAPAAPASLRSGAAGAVYLFEETLQLPATLYEDAAARKSGGRAAFDRKELTLLVLPADKSSKGASAALGSLMLNLAEYAAAGEARSQRAFPLAGGAKLLLTVGCRGGGGLAVEPSQSSLESAAGAAAVGAGGEEEDLPSRLSTDDEGSRPFSRADSRPGSRAEAAAAGLLAGGTLGAVPEEGQGPINRLAGSSSWRQQDALAAPAGAGSLRFQQQQQPVAAAAVEEQEAEAAEQPEAEPSGQLDADVFLVDDSLDADVSLEASASVRRNLGSALQRAEASEASRPAEAEVEAEAASSLQAAVEVQSRLASGSFGAAAGAAAAPAAAPAALGLEWGNSARMRQRLAVPATPVEPQRADLQSPDSFSTGAQSSVLSAAGDPAVPFSVPPSTHRRFAQRGDDGGAAARRWAWRRKGTAAAGVGAGISVFQRARIASVSKHDSADGAGPAGLATGASVEASAHSTTSSGTPTVELSSKRTTTEEAAAAPQQQQQQSAASAAGGAAPVQQQGGAAPGSSAFSAAAGATAGDHGAAGFQRTSFEAAALAATQRQRSLVGGSSRMLPALSLLDSLALPSPVESAPYPNQLLVESLAVELRNLAALESAVYLAGGRKAFAGAGAGAVGTNRQLHAPARRLARTIISLGPQDGLAFGIHAIRAIEATAGAASGDMHRLTFWWSNILQLRVQLSALVADAGAAGVAGGRAEGGLERQCSETHLSPRAALAAAAGAKHGLEWMQFLLPQLRELEAWLFAEMLKHLWWRVLLHSVTALQPGTSGNTSPPSTAHANGAAGRGGGATGTMRSATSAPHLAGALARGVSDEQAGRASLQGTPRCFESPEEEAVHRWVLGLHGVERALKDTSRPCPAPRTHLSLLHRQLIVALLRRLDTLLFRKLLLDETEGPPLFRLPSMSGRGGDAFSRSAEADEVLGAGGTEAAVVGLLEPGVLPFQRGAVTFGTGVNLKMAVSRLTGWAADCGVKEDKLPQAARSTDMSDYRLFPCLRATADLLMMPKEVLTDRQIRREVVPGLPLHRVCQLLERFEPDDCAPDPLPPGLLDALQGESPRSEGASTPSPTSKAEEEYPPPAEAMLLADGIVEPLSLEMDEESEDELESLAGAALRGSSEVAAPPEELRVQRFVLLWNLWAAR